MLKEEGFEINKKCDGIYEVIGNTMFYIQIIVSKELVPKENTWIRLLTSDVTKNEYSMFVSKMNGFKTEGQEKQLHLADSLAEVVTSANKEKIKKWKEDESMCEALKEIMAPEIEAESDAKLKNAYSEMSRAIELINSGKKNKTDLLNEGIPEEIITIVLRIQ